MDYKIFSGNSSINLAKKVTKYLNCSLSEIDIARFKDGEINIEIKENNLKNKSIYLIHSTGYPVNDNIIELLLIVDALERCLVKDIILIIPYLAYSRQDRILLEHNNALSSKVIANIITISKKVKKIITCDLHSEQIQGFFNIPNESINILDVIQQDIRKNYDNIIIASPDIGGVKKARNLLKFLDNEYGKIIFIEKHRPKSNESLIMNVIGDVNNKNCIFIDDIIDTGGTLFQAAKIFKQKGAKSCIAYCTHPILSDNALLKLNSSLLDKLIITDSLYINENYIKNNKKIRVISLYEKIANLIIKDFTK